MSMVLNQIEAHVWEMFTLNQLVVEPYPNGQVVRVRYPHLHTAVGVFKKTVAKMLIHSVTNWNDSNTPTSFVQIAGFVQSYKREPEIDDVIRVRVNQPVSIRQDKHTGWWELHCEIRSIEFVGKLD
jgi:hypothetical protein